MKEITQQELRNQLVSGQPVTVLDIREENEYHDWHIFGSVNVPVYNAINAGDETGVGKTLQSAGLANDKPIAVVCRMGNTSRMAAYLLDSLGFDAASLEGGIFGWSTAWTEARIPLSTADNGAIIQVRRNGKGCLSYIFGSNGEAIVVDPCVDADVYREIAKREGLAITLVLETHVHADHISRARALCEATGATMALPKNDRVTFDYKAIADGDALNVGNITIKAIATPGHTMESMCFDLDGELLLTGDTIFVDNIGRPDLEKGDSGAEAGARALYKSLHDRVLKLKPETVICPGHTSDPIGFDGSALVAPLGDIVPSVELLTIDEEAFAKKIPNLLGQKPPNFQRVISINEGKAELGWLDPLELEAGPNRCAVK